MFLGQQPRPCPLRLSPAAVVPWGLGGLLQGPDCFQLYLGKLAALIAALMGVATCLAALLAAKRLAAIPGRLVSACFSGLRWKLLAGKAKEMLLSGWVPCSVMLQITQGWKVQSDRIGGNRVLCTCVPLRQQRGYYHCCAYHGLLEGLHHRSFGMRRWQQQQEKDPPAFSCFWRKIKRQIY